MNDQFIAFYPSQNLEQCRHFYQDTLGLELVRDQGVCLIFKVALNAYVGFCSHLEPEENPNFIITLIKENVDEIYKDLKQKGADVQNEPKLNEKYQIYHFFVRDPNGYRLEIQRFLTPL